MIYKSEKEKRVLDILVGEKVVPSKGSFEPSKLMIDSFYEIYGSLYSKDKKIDRSNNIRYAKKLAALSLINLSKSRSDSITRQVNKKLKIRSGFLYIISNPAYTGYYKVGITKDLEGRLRSYQTYDPHRKFKIEHSTFCKDIRQEEKRIISKFSVDLKNGEWVRADKAQAIFREINSLI